MHTHQAVVTPECDKDLPRVCYPCASTPLLHSCRSLSQTLDLFEAKSHCMPQPDALITAVGTHVYWWDGRRQQWVEDGGWREVMQQGWSEQAVRAAVETAMDKVGSSRPIGLRGMLQRRWSVQQVVSTAADRGIEQMAENGKARLREEDCGWSCSMDGVSRRCRLAFAHCCPV